MIISTEQAKNGKLHLFKDGEYISTVDAAFWYSQGIHDGDALSEEALTELLAESEKRRALHSAMSILSRRAHSEKELYDKLRLKEYSAAAREYAVTRAVEIKLLDDEEYAERLAQSLLERKGYAFDRIRMELSNKGINRDIIENTLEKLDNDPVMRIIELINSRFPSFSEDEKSRNKAIAALLRLGYNINDIKSAIREGMLD